MRRLLLSSLLLLCLRLPGQSLTVDVDDPPDLQTNFAWIPFGFFSESFGLGLGVGGVLSHWPHPENSVLGAATLGTSGSYNLALGASQLRVPGLDRLFIAPMAVLARYKNQDLYVGRNNPGFEGQRAGAHGSSPDNILEATQWDNWAEIEFRYLLPIGHGRTGPLVNPYVVNDGVLTRGATGGSSWNPLVSGRTFLILTPAWRAQTLDNDDLDLPVETLNLEVGLRWDNRDYPYNPSKGTLLEATYQRDFRDEDVLGGWENWQAQAEQVVDLGGGSLSGQRVLAFDVWTAYTPTWETDADGNVVRRPPQYEGATLGGLTRLRGFESNRFQDKAALLYTAEFRVIPDWQPLTKLRALDWAKIRYWQWVLFAEAGRVNDSWDLSELHSDLNVDAGFSIRGMLASAVCRLDFAFSEEGTRVVAMYGHPF